VVLPGRTGAGKFNVVLVIDDETDVRRILKRMLEARGLAVILTTGFGQALPGARIVWRVIPGVATGRIMKAAAHSALARQANAQTLSYTRSRLPG